MDIDGLAIREGTNKRVLELYRKYGDYTWFDAVVGMPDIDELARMDHNINYKYILNKFAGKDGSQ